MLRTKISSALVAAAAALFMAGSASAQQVEITGVVANGNGCRNGDVSGFIQGNLAFIGFSNYMVQSTRQQPFQTRNCSVAVGITLEAGVEMQFLTFDWMGSWNLAPGSQGTFFRTAFFGGQRVFSNLREDYFAGFSPIQISDNVRGITLTACEDLQTIARVNTTLSVAGMGQGDGGRIDSLDVGAFRETLLQFRLTRANCGGGTIGGDSLNPTTRPGSGGTPAPPRRRGGSFFGF